MATVKLLLKESIKNVGRVGDLVEVSPGYARNFLLPKDLAVHPTPNNVKKVESSAAGDRAHAEPRSPRSAGSDDRAAQGG